MKPKWYAAYTKYQHEFKFRDALKLKGILCYLPTDTQGYALFSCYVFVFLEENKLHLTRYLRGFVRWVSFGERPAVIPTQQIETMQAISQMTRDVSSQSTKLIRGEQVRIIRGPLRGQVGVLTRDQGSNKLALEISQLNQAIVITIPLEWVIPL